MALSVTHAIEHVRHALRSRPAEEIQGRALINECGEWIAAMHPWKWLERRSVQLNLRGKVPGITASAYVAGMRTITTSAALPSTYSFVGGDTIRMTDVGTLQGVNRLQEFTMSSATGSTIVLDSPGLGTTAADNTANDGNTSWTAEIAVGYTVLPDDFMELIAYDATDSLINSLELTTLQHLLELRTNQIEIAAWNFYGAIVSFVDTTDNDRIKQRIEIWPDPPANNTESFTIFYRQSWPRITTEQEVIQIPEWFEPLFIYALRNYARGYEQDADNQKTMGQRMGEVVESPQWRAMVERDGAVQPDYGPMRGGAVQSMPQGYNRFLRRTVAGPS